MGNVCRATRATRTGIADVSSGKPELSAIQEVNWRFIGNALIDAALVTISRLIVNSH
jgi:hypothetical protein